MKTADEIAADLFAGLEGVADGPWHASCLYSIGRETDPTDIHLEDDDDTSLAFFEELGLESLLLAKHFARCDPQSIRALIEDRAMWKARAEMAGGSAAKTKDLDILGLLRLGQELLAEEPDTGMAALCKRAADEIERLRRELNDRDMWKARVGSLMEKNTCP